MIENKISQFAPQYFLMYLTFIQSKGQVLCPLKLSNTARLLAPIPLVGRDYEETQAGAYRQVTVFPDHSVKLLAGEEPVARPSAHQKGLLQ